MTVKSRESWVVGANGHPDFPLQNLPLGVFSPPGGSPRGGVAIGDMILDIGAALDAALFGGEARRAAEAARGAYLNPYFALGGPPRAAFRERLLALLHADSGDQAALRNCLRAQAECAIHLPARVGDYTDFYVGIHHAESIGRLIRPDNPLLPNYKYVPIGYHGRASTLRVSGRDVRRPNGQTLAPGSIEPVVGPSRKLDYELELGIWIGPGNPDGGPISIADAKRHVAGLCLLNDWSARDMQVWEYQPLGPFLAKSFHTTVSPWVVTTEALAPYRRAQPRRPQGDPSPLPYLLDADDQSNGAFDIELGVWLHTAQQRDRGLPEQLLSSSNTVYMYWTVAQMIAHHSSNGCELLPGDLFGSGTLSGPLPDQGGSLMELTAGGQRPLKLEGGELRAFLEDGDEVILRAHCVGEGLPRIGFGECRGRVSVVRTSSAPNGPRAV